MRRAMEAVAVTRRKLPPGEIVPRSYVFQGGRRGRHPDRRAAVGAVRSGKGSLVIYNFMFPRGAGDARPGPGTLEPLWNLFDLTLEGRPSDWDEQLSCS